VNFDLTDDQRTIKSTARELLAARYPLAEVRRLALEDERGFTDAQWGEMVELGWPEIAEIGTVEMIVVAEELGYALAPTPLQSAWAAGLLGADISGGRRGAVVVGAPTPAPPTCWSTGTAPRSPGRRSSPSARSTRRGGCSACPVESAGRRTATSTSTAHAGRRPS
jgi:hypothetical protein